MSYCRNRGMTLPVVAIGGILVDDVRELRLTGVDGIAVSGLILNSDDKESTTIKILQSWKD